MLLDAHYKRNRGYLCFGIVLCILFGILSRSQLPLPYLFQTYGGDILWATMFYFIFACLKPDISIKALSLITLVFSFLIEYSQLLTMPWLQALRQTPLRFLLGQGFLISDLLCYVIGCILACSIDIVFKKKNH